MNPDTFQAVVDLQIRKFDAEVYPVVVVTFPSTPMALLEVLTYAPDNVRLYSSNNKDLELRVDNDYVTDLDDRNGNLQEFRTLLDNGSVFALTLVVAGEDNSGEAYILTRTLMAENFTGKVISNIGPNRMSYQAACGAATTVTEGIIDQLPGRTFKDAAELAMSILKEGIEEYPLPAIPASLN